MSRLFTPINGSGKAISGTGASVDTALSTTGSANCIKVEAVTNVFFIRVGASGGTAVVNTDMLINPGQVYYLPIGEADTNIQSFGAAGTLYVTSGYTNTGT